MYKTRLLYTILPFLFCTTVIVSGQERLYRNEFPLSDVKLMDGTFKHARDLNIQTLLKYDVDRLVAPYRKEAGLPEKAPLFPNWAGLDGHVGGHYLTALAMNYASTGNAECKRRMEYFLSELKACQKANEINHPEWAVGYIGGVPNGKVIWPDLKNGDFKAYRAAWVPWYNVHKLYAGLRDAWLYTGNEDAKQIFLKFCDWGLNITSPLTDAQMQLMLDIEHGGMNEIFADAWHMTGDEKYLIAAKRFSHRMLLDAMASKIDNLDNKHANTQVPKAVGFQRIAELTNDETYYNAGLFFWETVTGNRSLAFGGNSRREHFPGVAACQEFISDIEGPETCNSYNMLKLTEELFRISPDARFADYYEKTLFNHILSSQHPEHGGYVYFTPARPGHYRVYSAPNQAMWCCVGSGMENHSKYNQFIYTHNDDALYLNLFIASELTWKEKGLKFKQETTFPDEGKTKITITEGSARFKLMVRYPGWVDKGALKVMINGEQFGISSKPSSYVAIDRKWNAGDVVTIILPMHISIEHLPNVPQYIAFLNGPILLGARTGNEDLKGLIADDSRWGHIAGGKKLPVTESPVLIADDISKISDNLVQSKDNPVNFVFSRDSKMINPREIELEPFARIHDSRYTIYWMVMNEEKSRKYLDSLAIQGKKMPELQDRKTEFVAPGKQQP